MSGLKLRSGAGPYDEKLEIRFAGRVRLAGDLSDVQVIVTGAGREPPVDQRAAGGA